MVIPLLANQDLTPILGTLQIKHTICDCTISNCVAHWTCKKLTNLIRIPLKATSLDIKHANIGSTRILIIPPNPSLI